MTPQPLCFFPALCHRLSALLWLSACVWLASPSPAGADSHHLHGEDGAPLWVGQGAILQRTFRPSHPMRLQSKRLVRVGLRWDGPDHLEWQVRFSQDGQRWSPWITARTTWSEGQLHNGHADPPAKWAAWVEVRVVGEGYPSFAAVELIPSLGPLARPATSAPPVTPAPPPADAFSLINGILGISGPYNPRSAWNAAKAKCSSRNPTKTRIAIHHTVTPNNDSASPQSRLRGIQSYHQNNRGWCDIGYHLLISQDGRAWEGRPADVLGTHVANNNTNTLGISFIGTFTSVTPNSKMLCTGAKLIDWAVKTFGIKRNRSAIMGHRQFSGNSTSCPGAQLYAQLSNMITQSSNSGNCSVTPPKCDNVKSANLNGGRLNIRQSSTANSKKLGDMPENTCLKVLSKTTSGQSIYGDTTWYKITYNNITGWISGYYAVCSNCKPPPPPEGTLKGFAYDKSAGKNKRLADATIAITSGPTLKTKSDGSFSASLAPGTYTLKASKGGYKALSQQAKITSGQTTNVELALAPESQPPQDIQAPTITITAPKDGAQVSQNTLTVTGTITDNHKVDKAELNGKTLKLDAKGAFSQSVTLQPGQQTLQVDAWDPASNKGTAQVTVIYVPADETSNEPTTEPTAEPTANEASTEAPTSTEDAGPADTPTTSRPDDNPLALDSNVGLPCSKPGDCTSSQVCDNGTCKSMLAPNLTNAVEGGCGCQSNPTQLPLWGLLLVCFGLLLRKSKSARA